ncbi:hypothetical protein [Actinomycetospora termitidis]|uniref:DUF3040 family protein n=1 Tax=Actinomycetospora termitidis TaxID=3053470 RepID=A0ABT7M6V8_9PSEU|nr:hypothetical protein [Actinomycetospora sp. Odt1-22]MDL5156397.1 hypothetical protein [Actinomycetospora sp. Odt1-22]
MTHDAGRPLDAREQDEFEAILSGYRRTARRPGDAPAPVVVGVVLVGAVVVAVLTALLPSPLNLWVPVVVLGVVATLAVVRGVAENSAR